MIDTRRVLVATALALASGFPARAQSLSPSFVITSGPDTVAAESFSKTPSALTGILRLPTQQLRARYVIHLRPDGSIAEAEVMEDPGYFSGTITFDERAAVDARARGLPPRRFIVAPAGTYPLVGTSIALMEQLARVTHATSRDSTSAQVINIRNRILGTATIKRIGTDSLAIICNGCQRVDSHQEIHVGVSPAGDFTGGSSIDQGWVITRH